MMKRICALILAFAAVLSMAACGGNAEAGKNVDLNALYETMDQTLPDMLRLEDADTVLNFFGIQSEDCVQMVTAICADGLSADEVWLIEATDAEALARIEELAKNRLVAKEEETVSYAPEQYKVVQKAELLIEGNYLALLVSPDVQTLKAAFTEAVK
jgi:hypothetical protein